MPAVTSVTNFSDGNVLTASALNAVNCGIHVYSNAAARDAAYGGTGERTLVEGEYAYLLDTDQTLVYSGSSWIAVGVAPGLVLVKSQTVGSAVSSVEVTGAFSATYDAYKIILTGGTCSTNNQGLTMVLGASTTTYSGGYVYYASNGSTTSPGTPGAVSIGTSLWQTIGTGTTSANGFSMEMQNPFLAQHTYMQTSQYDPVNLLVKMNFGIHASNTSYSAFTIATTAGTMTGGTIRVYGYANS